MEISVHVITVRVFIKKDFLNNSIDLKARHVDFFLFFFISFIVFFFQKGLPQHPGAQNSIGLKARHVKFCELAFVVIIIANLLSFFINLLSFLSLFVVIIKRKKKPLAFVIIFYQRNYHFYDFFSTIREIYF